MQESALQIKVAILGTHNVGKTCIINRYLYRKFDLVNSTVEASFGSKFESFENNLYNLQIWDTAGEEKFSIKKE